MPKIFQEFRLDEEAMEETREKARKAHPGKKLTELLPSTPGAQLIQKLKEKGYTVLCSVTIIDGIPVSLIVGTEIDQKRLIKADFSEIIGNLGVAAEWFVSGEGYFSSDD